MEKEKEVRVAVILGMSEKAVAGRMRGQAPK
jgi:hypothetical protein